MSDEAALGCLRLYCVGSTKYAVGIPNILRIISIGVPDILIYGAGVPKTGEAKYPVKPGQTQRDMPASSYSLKTEF